MTNEGLYTTSRREHGSSITIRCNKVHNTAPVIMYFLCHVFVKRTVIMAVSFSTRQVQPRSRQDKPV